VPVPSAWPKWTFGKDLLLFGLEPKSLRSILRRFSELFDQLREERDFEFGTEVLPSTVSVSLSSESEPESARDGGAAISVQVV